VPPSGARDLRPSIALDADLLDIGSADRRGDRGSDRKD
jgi:hypothetical protein